MKATSLHQPWASLVAYGFKTIETRDRRPPQAIIGQTIAIHAAKRPIDWDLVNNCGNLAFTETVTRMRLDDFHFPYGAVLATARLSLAMVVLDHKTDGEYVICSKGLPDSSDTLEIPTDPYGNFAPGRWLWFLEDIKSLAEPVPARRWPSNFWELGDLTCLAPQVPATAHLPDKGKDRPQGNRHDQ